MDIILHSVESVASIAIMICLGVLLARKGWFDEDNAKLIADLVMKVSLPCLIFYNITSSFGNISFWSLAKGFISPTISIAVSLLMGHICCNLFKIPRGRRAIFKSAFFLANCMFIGLPINQVLFGTESTIYVFEYYIPNTITAWSIGVYIFAKEGVSDTMSGGFIDIVKKLLASPLSGLLLAFIFLFLELPVPKVVKTSVFFIGSMTTPLSMIFVGIALSQNRLEEIKITFEMLVAYIGRFIVSPFIVFLVHLIMPLNPLEFGVIFIQAGTPVAAVVPVLAATYKLDTKYAALITSISTLLFMFLVPLYMWILHNIVIL